jgi:hypothetical protein
MGIYQFISPVIGAAITVQCHSISAIFYYSINFIQESDNMIILESSGIGLLILLVFPLTKRIDNPNAIL